jgi:endonuclease-8
MPEGPSIVIMKEAMQAFEGGIVTAAGGTAKIDYQRLIGQPVQAFRSWGKHFLIQFPSFALRVHLLLFGSYRIDSPREGTPRLSLHFDRGKLDFYACSVKLLEGSLDAAYDWSADLMSAHWDAAAARAKLKSRPALLACDALLDQNVFAGSGNIIKNEVLYRIRVHPESAIGALPARKLSELIEQARVYSFEFLQWKREGVLSRHWLAHKQTSCVRCRIPLQYRAALGRSRRRAFFCERCQKRYVPGSSS